MARTGTGGPERVEEADQDVPCVPFLICPSAHDVLLMLMIVSSRPGAGGFRIRANHLWLVPILAGTHARLVIKRVVFPGARIVCRAWDRARGPRRRVRKERQKGLPRSATSYSQFMRCTCVSLAGRGVQTYLISSYLNILELIYVQRT
jgi:hypothetical protein